VTWDEERGSECQSEGHCPLPVFISPSSVSFYWLSLCLSSVTLRSFCDSDALVSGQESSHFPSSFPSTKFNIHLKEFLYFLRAGFSQIYPRRSTLECVSKSLVCPAVFQHCKSAHHHKESRPPTFRPIQGCAGWLQGASPHRFQSSGQFHLLVAHWPKSLSPVSFPLGPLPRLFPSNSSTWWRNKLISPTPGESLIIKREEKK